MRSSIRLVFDPFKLIVEIVKDLYPGTRADVYYSAQATKKEFGSTVFGGKIPHVLISYKTPLGASPEILAHELAHVIAGEKAEHGRKWERVFAKIHREYSKRIVALAKRTGLKTEKST